jgi:hypothetical protein
MRLFAALTKGWNCSVETHHAGAVVYREGNREFTFPAYEEDGMLVLVGSPSLEQVRFFFNWYPCQATLSPETLRSVVERIQEHMFEKGVETRLFERSEDFEYYPELFEHRSHALELIASSGCEWMRDYASIDLLQEDYGLEVCGIRHEQQIHTIIETLQCGFPHWHHLQVSTREHGLEEGWSVSVSMFRPRSRTPGQCEGDWLE